MTTLVFAIARSPTLAPIVPKLLHAHSIRIAVVLWRNWTGQGLQTLVTSRLGFVFVPMALALVGCARQSLRAALTTIAVSAASAGGESVSAVQDGQVICANTKLPI